MCPQNYNLTLKQISIHSSELIPTYCYLASALPSTVFTPFIFFNTIPPLLRYMSPHKSSMSQCECGYQQGRTHD